ncbi:MAG: hypothetical protein JJU29_08035 [Verrucomicrobia bacterium]|nr:hypothetical protein [Verrucomicrobiota bacterium]MCH8511886.1 hypothetical protein [Kiritimatiellia bacterium]
MKKKLIVPVLTITVGVAWFLNVLEVIPGVDWVWTLGLATAGILSISIGGLNKFTVVVGPLLVVASICSLLRQTGRLVVDHEIPVLVITLGILMLISQLSPLEKPEALRMDDGDADNPRGN